MADITSNLTHQWLCNDNAASTTVVAQVGGVNGTLTNAGNTSASTVAGPKSAISGGLGFDGSNDFINTANTADKLVTDPFTIALWVKPNSTSPTTTQMIVTKQQSSGSFVGYFLYRDGTAAGDPYKWGYFSGGGIEISGACTNSTAWRHLVATNSGSNTTAGLALYENGVLLTPTATLNTPPVLSTSNTVNLQIGARGGGAVFAGAVADVRLYSRALSADDVAALYAYPAGNLAAANYYRRLFGAEAGTGV